MNIYIPVIELGAGLIVDSRSGVQVGVARNQQRLHLTAPRCHDQDSPGKRAGQHPHEIYVHALATAAGAIPNYTGRG